uniref:Cytochrome b5 n=1 Tax=Glossina morsitans morsitans TaxID=37546 RepID=A0A1B0FHL8_GLOMM
MVKQISLAEVKEHNIASDLWVIIENKVYDLTKFRDECVIEIGNILKKNIHAQHPGGEEVLVEVAGRDATKDFDEVGHSQDAKDMMKKYCIGELEGKPTEMELPVSDTQGKLKVDQQLSKMFGLNHNLCYETNTNIANNSNTTNAQMPNELYPKNKEIGITVGAVIIGVVAVLLVKKIFF